MKIYKGFVLLAAFALLMCGSALADITGHTVDIQFLYPNANTQYGLSNSGVVGGSGVSLNLFGNQLVTVFGTHVDMSGLRNSGFTGATFNGISVTDLSNPGGFTSFSLDPATNLAGFDLSRVFISNGVLYINYQGLSTPEGELASVDFAEGQATPEPGSLVLLGSGLLGMAGTIRRRFIA